MYSGGKLFAYSPKTQPGDTETTRIVGANALAKERVMLSIAAFEAQYATLLPIAVTAATEEILTIKPLPLCINKSLQARIIANEPLKLVVKILSIHSSVKASRSSCGTGVVIPALLTKMSNLPYFSRIKWANSANLELSSTGAWKVE